MGDKGMEDLLSGRAADQGSLSIVTRSLAAGLAAALFLFSASLSATEFEKLSEEERLKLQAGEVVYKSVYTEYEDGKIKGHGQSMILINAPLDQCWEIFTQFNTWHKYWPKIIGSAVVEQKPGGALVFRRSRFAGIKIEYSVIYKIDRDKYRIDFELDQSRPHDIKYTAGYFLFEEISPGASLFVYAVTDLDTGLPVPEVVRETIQKRDLPDCAENVKKRIESGGTWEKEKIF